MFVFFCFYFLLTFCTMCPWKDGQEDDGLLQLARVAVNQGRGRGSILLAPLHYINDA